MFCFAKKKSSRTKNTDACTSFNRLHNGGKNKHDDVPDGMAMFAIFAQELSGGTIQVMQRKF